MGKTGTSALASLFPGVACGHEPEAEALIEAILDYEAGRSGWPRLVEAVVARDARLGLEIDVSNLNVFILDLLVKLAPDARFVLTVRDPWSWLDSIVNHYASRPPTSRWRAFAEHRFGAGDAAHPPEERVLAELGLHPLGGYLGYWRAHLEKALATVPAERLLVVPTDRIVAEAERIATFGGFAAANVDRTRLREYRNPAKQPIVQGVPKDHLDALVRLHCDPLAERLFPAIRSAEDAGLRPTRG